MPRQTEYEDDWNEVDPDEEDDALNAADDGEPTVPCPRCRRQIHEDSPRCPHCGNYVSEEDAPPGRKPWWILAGTLRVSLRSFIGHHWQQQSHLFVIRALFGIIGRLGKVPVQGIR